MEIIIKAVLAVVSPDMVQERHYFLEMLQAPTCIWAIRVICIAALVGALVIYWKMKGKNGE